MTYKDEILNNYEYSFVEEYEKWKTLVSEINNFIPIYLESMELENYDIPAFTYDEFCLSYKEEVAKFLDNNKTLTPSSVHYILDLLVKRRILNHISLDDFVNYTNIPDTNWDIPKKDI